jgi:DNA-binding response OmpR family regulator
VEFQLLKVLAERPGRIYTRDQLMDAMSATSGSSPTAPWTVT